MHAIDIFSAFDPIIKKNIEQWLNDEYDEDTKTTIRQLLKDDPKKLLDAFFTHVSFGTGGLRGLMGVGSNRINLYTIKTASQALANYLHKQFNSSRTLSIFIAYDSRHQSRAFAEAAAKVFAGNNIRVYLSKKICPTPLASFGGRLKQCSAIVNITASHNPPLYNGYKVYWKDGGQIVPPHDLGVMQEMHTITKMSMIKEIKSTSHELIEEIGDEIDIAYIKAVSLTQLYPKQNTIFGNHLKIAYSSLHGTGFHIMPKILSAWGFNNLSLIEEQCIPDGNFPTVVLPNPEDKEALKLGIQTLERIKGDLLIVNDPDADRMSAAVMHQNQGHYLNGNQISCLCLNHICQALVNQNKLSEKACFIKTLATSELFQSIATAFSRPCFNVHTGFKHIAEKIQEWEKHPNEYEFVFGAEESCGYLFGSQVRDKDGIHSGALLCEIGLHAKLQGKTLIDQLHQLYRKYGTHYEKLFTIHFEDTQFGQEQITQVMLHLRKNLPFIIDGIKIAKFEDYLKGISTDLRDGHQQPLHLPRSNVFLFWLEDGCKLMIRPSGTEPKIKLYIGVVDKHTANTYIALNECEKRADRLINEFNQILKNIDVK